MPSCTPFHRAGCFALLVALVGCEVGRAPAAFAIVDSAGVEIATSTRPLWAEPDVPTVDPTPILDLSLAGTSPAHTFYRVADFQRLRDGRFIVADGGSSELRVFDADGAHIASIGRRGDGPGEYTGFRSVAQMRGDSIVVLSPSRVTVLSSELAMGRTFPTPPALFGEPVGDSALMFARPPTIPDALPSGNGGIVRSQAALSLWDLAGDSIGTFGSIAGHEQLLLREGEGFLLYSFPYMRRGTLATADGVIATGDAERFRIDVLSHDGRLRRVIQIDDYDLTVPTTELEAERDTFRSAGIRDIEVALSRTRRPAYTDLIYDDSGRLWAGGHLPYTATDAPRLWEVFDVDGRWLSQIISPGRFDVTQVSGELILGVWRDELDVEHPVVLRTSWPTDRRETP